MLDIKFIRENTDKIKEAARLKRIDLDLDKLLQVDDRRRELIAQNDELRRQRNIAAQNRDMSAGRKIKDDLDKLKAETEQVEHDFLELMVKVPNIPSPDTPVGDSDAQNQEIFRSIEGLPKFDFKPKDHIQLGKELDILDLENGAKVAGYRGYYLKNEGVMLVMALMMYSMKKIIAHGFTPMIPPTMVKQFALFGSGYFKGLEYDPEVDEIYQVATSDKDASGELSRDKKFLVGTAEPSLLAYYAGETLKEEDLPVKVCGFSQCYRSEIGSYGKETKGLYRVHEFLKVEQVVISKADVEESDKLQQEMLQLSKDLLADLGLPYRVLQICTGDLGSGKYKQYDTEVYLPGMEKWGETGSASNFLDWQARRLDIKYVDNEGNKKVAFLLNATAMPSPRPFIAILENYQQDDGSIRVPDVLIPFTGFSQILPKK